MKRRPDHATTARDEALFSSADSATNPRLDHHRALQQTVRRFAEREIRPLAAAMDEAGEVPPALVTRLGELGITGLPFPAEYGGSEGDFLSLVIALEELARVDSSIAVTVEASVALAGQLLSHFGSHEQKRRWLRPLAEGKILGSFGLTEPEAGSDTRAIVTSAVLDGDEWVINGHKSFITNAGTELTGLIVVAAVSTDRHGGKEYNTILVPWGTAGYEPGKRLRKIGWHASDTRGVAFTDCRVSADNLVGEQGEGLHQCLAVLAEARVGFAAMGVGLAQGCLEMSLAYARQRVTFGKPLDQHQAIQFKLADMAVQVDLARLATYRAAGLIGEGKPFRKEGAIAKLFASEAAVRVAEEAVQIHGGYGYIEETPVARFYRDAKILTIAEGSSEVQRMIIARELGCADQGG